MSLLKKAYEYHDRRQKQVLNKESSTQRLRRWIWYNSPYFLLITTILSLITFIGIMWYGIGPCLETGNYYNHLQNCASIIGGNII